MALHGVAALEQERVQNLTLTCKVGTKRSLEKAYISDKVDLQDMVKRRRLEKDLTVSFKRDSPNSRIVESNHFRGGFRGGRNFRGRGQRGGRGSYNTFYAGKENSNGGNNNYNNNNNNNNNNKNTRKYIEWEHSFVLPDSVSISDRLTKSIRAWHEIKASKYIIHLLTHGIDLDFVSLPAPNKPITYDLNIEVEQEAWLKQVKRFRDLKCVRKLSPQEMESAVFAPMFVRPKKDSPEYRCIYDMRYVNRHIRYKHFKNEGLHTVRELVRCNDWMSKVDVKDAYLHCPVRWEHHKFMAYVDENGEFWCFVALPFGLTSAPRWFTKIMREVITYFRSLGIRLMVYMDDIVIFTEVVGGEFDAAKEKARFTHNFVVQKLKELGWCISMKPKNI